ncbi:hypothetical protein BN1708_020375, partial [Verticillium longisporum]
AHPQRGPRPRGLGPRAARAPRRRRPHRHARVRPRGAGPLHRPGPGREPVLRGRGAAGRRRGVQEQRADALLQGHWRRVRAVGSRLHPRLSEAAC